ncbi:MAG: HAD family phosphatase [Cyclobacteriaceae bacterium]|nr:HAD family phosphatase [Cyclobacteriaceae bacterium]
MQKVKNIIFDLGGVIINLDILKTLRDFAAITGVGVEEVKEKYFNAPFFVLYETGKISDAEFREAIRNMSGRTLHDDEIDEAWNAMLLDLPAERLEWIKAIKNDYKIVVLSNTNAMHIRKFLEIFKEQTPYQHPLEIFDHMYYSHEIHLRKPDKECFQFVLDHAGFKAEETLLLDDNSDNISTAKSMNLHTLQVDVNQLRPTMLPNGIS